MDKQDLIFWDFFHQIEKELSYERWIDKYLLFLDTLLLSKTIRLQKGDEWSQFKSFCKFLYLQDIRDEAKFEQLLDTAIAREEKQLRAVLSETVINEDAETKTGDQSKKETPEDASVDDVEKPVIDEQAGKDLSGAGNFPEPGGSKNERSVYYNPPLQPGYQDNIAKKQKASFLLTDEYFPVSRRQMVKGWQFLRNKERSGIGDGIDIIATIKKIAKEGLFLEPEFNASFRNREDTIVIYADYRGSMAPFHELTNRLIISARGGGGHPKAPVYYFQNFPVGYVYKQSNLSGPVKLKESLAKANRNITLAIVISDAGASRGNTDDMHKQARLKMTKLFLSELNRSCAHIIWLNPMPSGRWKDTAAELISKLVFLMAPIFEHSHYNFQDTFRTVLKQNLKKTKVKK